MEYLKVIDTFAETDIFHRYLKLVADTDDNASLCRAVKFGDGELVDLCGGYKLACLFKGILRSQ